MFYDMKDKLKTADVQHIFAACVYDNSPEGITCTLNAYGDNNLWEMHGWVENGNLMGICGFEVHSKYVEIKHIAVHENNRGHGIGSAMVNALAAKFNMAVHAETDDDAVDFYRKCGFETTAFQKYNVRRWKCELRQL